MADSLKLSGARGRIRTTDTRIFSPLLYQLSYPGPMICMGSLTNIAATRYLAVACLYVQRFIIKKSCSLSRRIKMSIKSY